MVRIINSVLRLMTKDTPVALIVGCLIISLIALIYDAKPIDLRNINTLIYGISTLVCISWLCIIRWFPRSHQLHEYINQTELRKRYTEFLLLRLAKKLDDIEEHHINDEREGVDIWMEKSVEAHDEVQEAINIFRRDARMLLSANHETSPLAIEAMLNFCEDEEQALRSRYAHLNFVADDELLLSFLNP